MMRTSLIEVVAKLLPWIFGLIPITVGAFAYTVLRNWKYDARERRDAQRHFCEPRLPLAQTEHDEEEHWLRVLMAELQARGIHGFTSASASSTNDNTEEDVFSDSFEQTALTTVLDSTGLAPPDAKSAIERSIWKDSPRRGWPREGGQFEFKHLPTGSAVNLTRYGGCSWTAFVTLPRTPGVKELRLPRAFNQQYAADWVHGWSFSQIPSNQPREAVDIAKCWLLAALSGEVNVTDGALTPTRNKERDYFGQRERL